MENKKLYFKVYQSKDYMDIYYIDLVENILSLLKDEKSLLEDNDGELPVLEPVYMTEKEFSELPEFQGF